MLRKLSTASQKVELYKRECVIRLRERLSPCCKEHAGICLTHSLIHYIEIVPNSKKLQTSTEMWLLKTFKIQIA